MLVSLTSSASESNNILISEDINPQSPKQNSEHVIPYDHPTNLESDS